MSRELRPLPDNAGAREAPGSSGQLTEGSIEAEIALPTQPRRNTYLIQELKGLIQELKGKSRDLGG